jgi:hypothetical protein
MADLNLSRATTVGLTGVPDFIMAAKALDTDNASGDTITYFTNAITDMGYYNNDPIVFSAANALATWAFGKGWVAEDKNTTQELEHVSGRGNDTFSTIMWNHEVIKLIVGDAFLEIIWEDNDNTKAIANLVPISPERVRIFSESGRIKRYETWTGKKWKYIKKENMYHTSNKRIGDQVHGTSQLDAIRKTIDARQEAEADERVIKHRDKALGIVYYKTNNTGKITYANEQITKAVKNGDMVGMPEDTAKIEPYPSKSSEDRQNWISSRENFTFATFGVPRSMITSDGTTEVGGINGHLIFENIYGKEQLDEEEAIWQQMFRKVKFNRPPSLAPKVQDDAAANTGQTAIQPEEATPSVNR